MIKNTHYYFLWNRTCSGKSIDILFKKQTLLDRNTQTNIYIYQQDMLYQVNIIL
jgi:hypothetical protein